MNVLTDIVSLAVFFVSCVPSMAYINLPDHGGNSCPRHLHLLDWSLSRDRNACIQMAMFLCSFTLMILPPLDWIIMFSSV